MDQNNYNNYYPQQTPQPYQQPYQQPYTAPAGAQQPNLLVFGILSLCFTFIVGIILAAIGRKKGNAFIAQGGTLTGASKVGYILCKVGLIVSIIATIFIIIYIIAIAAIGGSYYYYY